MDYAPIEAFLVGQCGKTMQQAARTSYAEFLLLAEGQNKREREEWERLRWRVFMEWAISPNLKRRPHKPQDVLLFPWETKTAEVQHAEPLTESELDGLCKIFNIKRDNIINGKDQ